MSGPRAEVSVDFFADLSCPWCYVGWSALKAAAEQVSARVAVGLTWRTFLLAPDMPAEGLDRRAYLSQHYPPERLAASHKVLQEAAAAMGAPLNLDAIARLPNTIDAHRVVHWAAEDGLAEAAIDAIFYAYFADARDISARDVLLSCVEVAGLDSVRFGDWLASDKDRAQMLDLNRAAVQTGVTGVPVAVFNRRIPLMGAQAVDAYAQALTRAA